MKKIKNIELLKGRIEEMEVGITAIWSDCEINQIIDFSDTYDIFRWGTLKDGRHVIAWDDWEGNESAGISMRIFPEGTKQKGVIQFLFEMDLLDANLFPELVRVVPGE